MSPYVLTGATHTFRACSMIACIAAKKGANRRLSNLLIQFLEQRSNEDLNCSPNLAAARVRLASYSQVCYLPVAYAYAKTSLGKLIQDNQL